MNEPVRSYAPGTPERRELQAELARHDGLDPLDIPLIIGGEEVRTGDTERAVAPHDHQRTLAHWHQAGPTEVGRAIEASKSAWQEWSRMSWEDRAAVFLRAADLLAGPWRQRVNAATMLGQSKTVHQAEIDAACELIDFIRFNVHFAEEIASQQPRSPSGMWNRLEYRPLEGFIYAVTPFNFTAIAGNLPAAPALMGNVVLWKPSTAAMYSNYLVMKIFEEAGLPPGVINFVPGDPPTVTEALIDHEDFAGLHYTGSTSVFKQLWKKIGDGLDGYHNYPRIVGETGGKDFIVAHASADPEAVKTAILRGAFEYQGQKCSAVSRVYLPEGMWSEIREPLLRETEAIAMGDPTDFRNFMGAVIHEASFEKVTGYIDRAAAASDAEVIAGGTYDDAKGWFVRPTIIETTNPQYESMREEIFGPVVTVYAYPEEEWEETLRLVDQTSPYGLTGAVFSRDRAEARRAMDMLRHAAGNFYVNDKPTGSVVGQQPFGGGRASGTNDKAGSSMNLLRWVSARSIKETFVPATDYRYPSMAEDEE
ncbi:MAG: L-glutamate gamma-semialdehyde dehydrogenase [Gemmatimonadota bacterium]|nr:L-glutamate gamma-semialdehyde dehydrogenase [Gemmatimonadota bacterium]